MAGEDLLLTNISSALGMLASISTVNKERAINVNKATVKQKKSRHGSSTVNSNILTRIKHTRALAPKGKLF